jgi:hypothetical protein
MASRSELNEALDRYLNPTTAILYLPDNWVFRSDQDTMLRRRTANQIEFRVGGQDVFRVDGFGVVLEQGAFTFEEIVTAPSAPADGTECKMYFKGDKFILRYLEGATERWKYLGMTGTGVTWTHSLTEP